MRPGQLVARAGGAESAPCAENGEPHRGGVGCLHGVENCTGSKQGGCPSCAPGATLPYYPPHPCLVGGGGGHTIGVPGSPAQVKHKHNVITCNATYHKIAVAKTTYTSRYHINQIAK